MLRNLLLFSLLLSISACNKKSTIPHHGKGAANSLINETSPYLLQHAYNPVDWMPWGDKALTKAKEENKLIIISVGYAACHWCHVMEHESFEDSLVASEMNDNYVSIKVDREERPDVDDVYMTAATLINGRGGWPLNAIALPDGRPIFAGTYYPKDQWLKILKHFNEKQLSVPQELVEAAEKLTLGIAESNVLPVNESPFKFSKQELATVVSNCINEFDPKHGGRSGAPKFPMPNTYEFLMKYHWLTGDEAALHTVTTGLDGMARGGIYDHLGGGFARYATDAQWLVPHFEKMLYDNAQLIGVYAKAYQLTGNEIYKDRVTETIDFVERELMSPEGSYYSSLDADSEGEEGLFYIWTKAEIDSIINNEIEAKVFCEYYDVSKSGNWENHNILNIITDLPDLAAKHKLTTNQVEDLLDRNKAKLLAHRANRIRPGTDDKTLTSWNALMISGYVAAYNAIGEKRYLTKAVDNAQLLIKKQISSDGRLQRNYKAGRSSINAFLDDYALLMTAFLDLYQATFDIEWIEKTKLLCDYALLNFYNSDTRMFDYTSKLDPPLVARKAEYTDNVIPASNSSMARALYALGTLTYNRDLLDMSEQMLNNILDQVASTKYLSFYSNWMQLLIDKISMPYEIAIVGQDAIEKRNQLALNYIGNSLILGTQKEENLELLKSKYMDEVTMIYVCQNKVCKLPVEDTQAALGLLTN